MRMESRGRDYGTCRRCLPTNHGTSMNIARTSTKLNLSPSTVFAIVKTWPLRRIISWRDVDSRRCDAVLPKSSVLGRRYRESTDWPQKSVLNLTAQAAAISFSLTIRSDSPHRGFEPRAVSLSSRAHRRLRLRGLSRRAWLSFG